MHIVVKKVMFLCQNQGQFKNDIDCGFVQESSDFRQSFNLTNAQQNFGLCQLHYCQEIFH